MWWTWSIAGLILLSLEMVLPAGFFLFFFGVGAILTGLVIALAGVLNFELASWIPWALFSLFSVVCLISLRAKARVFLARKSVPRAAEFIGETCTVLREAIAARGKGIVELRGTQWQAKNMTDSILAIGAQVKVTAVSGLTVEVILAG